MKLFNTNTVLKSCIYFLIAFVITSCNTIGDQIQNIELEDKKISNIKDISLTKGDVIVLWTYYNLEYKENLPSYRIKYHIEKDDNTILFEVFNLLNNIDYSSKPIIRSSKNTDNTYITNDENGDEIEKNYTEWEFQKEEHQFIVEEDGSYSFDFKLYNDNSGFFSDEIKVVLRKL